MVRIGKFEEQKVLFDDSAGHDHTATGNKGARLGAGAINSTLMVATGALHGRSMGTGAVRFSTTATLVRMFFGTFTATRFYATTQTIAFDGATGFSELFAGFIYPANAIHASLMPLMQFATTGPASVAWNPASVGSGTVGDSMWVMAWGH